MLVPGFPSWSGPAGPTWLRRRSLHAGSLASITPDDERGRNLIKKDLRDSWATRTTTQNRFYRNQRQRGTADLGFTRAPSRRLRES